MQNSVKIYIKGCIMVLKNQLQNSVKRYTLYVYKNKTKTLKVLKKLFKIYTKVIPTIFKWIQSHTLCQG